MQCQQQQQHQQQQQQQQSNPAGEVRYTARVFLPKNKSLGISMAQFRAQPGATGLGGLQSGCMIQGFRPVEGKQLEVLVHLW